MKKIFISSKIEVIELSDVDVITTSGGVLEEGGNGFTTDDAPLEIFAS